MKETAGGILLGMVGVATMLFITGLTLYAIGTLFYKSYITIRSFIIRKLHKAKC